MAKAEPGAPTGTSVFDYLNYRRYLQDYYDRSKAENANFSYRLFSNRIGFKSKDFIYRIIHKEKVISESSVGMISEAIGHREKEAEYFECLVKFNQARTATEKNRYLARLDQLLRNRSPKQGASLLGADQFGLFSNWYNPVLYSLLGLGKFHPDHSRLAQLVYPPISAKEAKLAIAHLAGMGLIQEDKEGRLTVRDKSLTTDPELANLALQNFHLRSCELAAKAIANLPKEQRNVSGLTLGISRKTYERMTKRIASFREELARMADRDEEADRIYQLNFHFFPMSLPLKEGEKHA